MYYKLKISSFVNRYTFLKTFVIHCIRKKVYISLKFILGNISLKSILGLQQLKVNVVNSTYILNHFKLIHK